MKGRLLLVGALLVAVGACGEEEESDATVASPTTPGRVVIIDGGGDVVTLESDGTGERRLTDHGGSVLVWQPVPSASGTVAWGEVGAEGAAVAVGGGDSVLRTGVSSLPFYLSWSPQGDEVAVLHDGAAGGLEFEIVDVASGSSRIAGSGAPFYFSWSPAGTSLATHVGGRIVSVVGADGARVLDPSNGDFLAPIWTEAGIVSVRDGTLVRRAAPDADAVPIATLSGPVTAVASPDGRRIALQSVDPESAEIFASFQRVPAIPSNRVVVLDVDSGTVAAASAEPAFGYFWSPDGEALLVLVAGSEEAHLEWRIWSESGPEVVTAFVPSRSLVRDLLPFFDQYAQSWSPWAADSSAFAFTGSYGNAGTRGIWIQDRAGGEPQYLSEGSWVAWSAPR
jgi:hypothetical protein